MRAQKKSWKQNCFSWLRQRAKKVKALEFLCRVAEVFLPGPMQASMCDLVQVVVERLCLEVVLLAPANLSRLKH